jgi:hypothetical protein
MNKIKIKVPLKYQLFEYRHTMLIMYLCVYAVIFLTVVSRFLKTTETFGSNGSLELVSVITIFVIGLNSFKDNFKFFSANGVSRKMQFCSTAAALGILSCTLAFIDTINSVIFTHVTVYYPMFLEAYGHSMGITGFGYGSLLKSPVLAPQLLFENFLWLTFLYLLFSMIGLFITTLYYRMNRGLKIAVSIIVPVFFLNGIELLDTTFFGGQIGSFFLDFLYIAGGLYDNSNPYIAMVSMFLFTAVFAALTYLLARRASIKK